MNPRSPSSGLRAFSRTPRKTDRAASRRSFLRGWRGEEGLAAEADAAAPIAVVFVGRVAYPQDDAVTGYQDLGTFFSGLRASETGIVPGCLVLRHAGNVGLGGAGLIVREFTASSNAFLRDVLSGPWAKGGGGALRWAHPKARAAARRRGKTLKERRMLMTSRLFDAPCKRSAASTCG